MRLKDKDEQSYLSRKELDNLKMNNSSMRDDNLENLAEKDALEKHA